jgi:hypothetical protein
MGVPIRLGDLMKSRFAWSVTPTEIENAMVGGGSQSQSTLEEPFSEYQTSASASSLIRTGAAAMAMRCFKNGSFSQQLALKANCSAGWKFVERGPLFSSQSDYRINLGCAVLRHIRMLPAKLTFERRRRCWLQNVGAR